MSKAVSSNAGTVGRQAAVIAAASGLVLSIGLPANASETNREASPVTDFSAAAQLTVTAAPTAALSFERTVVASEAAPVVEVAAQSTDEADSTATVDETSTTDSNADTTAATATQSTGADAQATVQTASTKKDSASSAAASGLVGLAYSGIGSPYVWGGTTPAGWDCSGFTQWVYAQAGISIPRVQAWNSMTPTANPAPGDLVMQNGGAHVGIYVGNGMMISALNPSQGTFLHAVAATGSASYFTLR
ncbi:C40 family peptidase [Pseudarthrobacter sp. J1763]|uniref:C40 family peptidase n=1 Tax=Pseudarthrobacter sp. J1763 TaxID=3420445 RepID=UPI003D27A881